MNIAHKFLFGRYCNGNSPVHRLDARIKLAFIMLISFSFFFMSSVYEFIYPFTFLVVVILISRLKPLNVLRGIIPILWLMGFSFIFHCLIPPRNIEYALEISLRLLLLFCWATILTATTANIELAKAIAWYAGPLKIFKISPEDIALTFSLSLRFFPIILEEAEEVIKAHSLRNEKLGFLEKIEAFCIAFMIRVLNKARNIEHSLINRDFRESNLKDLNKFGRLRIADFAAIAVFAGYAVLTISSDPLWMQNI
jgi:energy-coupling factor transporter transmembrane protein EcfT